MLDSLLKDLGTRFSNHFVNCLFLFKLLPQNITELNTEQLADTVWNVFEKYGHHIINSSSSGGVALQSQVEM